MTIIRVIRKNHPLSIAYGIFIVLMLALMLVPLAVVILRASW